MDVVRELRERTLRTVERELVERAPREQIGTGCQRVAAVGEAIVTRRTPVGSDPDPSASWSARRATTPPWE